MDQTDAVNEAPAAVRWLLVALGVVCVGLAVLGAVLPVMPTAIFLMAAAACFARSSPKLERKLLGMRLFAPYRPYLDGRTPLTRRARVAAIAVMWLCVSISFAALATREDRSPPLLAALVALGVIATVVIATWRRGPRGREPAGVNRGGSTGAGDIASD